MPTVVKKFPYTKTGTTLARRLARVVGGRVVGKKKTTTKKRRKTYKKRRY